MSQMTVVIARRQFIAALGMAAVCPATAGGQRQFRIGLLNTGTTSTFFIKPFSAKLAELGYVEGRNIVLERRFAEGNAERLKEYASDLVRQRVDVIVTIGTPAGFAAKKATDT